MYLFPTFKSTRANRAPESALQGVLHRACLTVSIMLLYWTEAVGSVSFKSVLNQDLDVS